MRNDTDFHVPGIRPGGVLLAGEAMGLFTAGQEGPCSTVGTFQASVAGAELNVAIGLKRLGQHPAYLTKVGDDPLGVRIRMLMESERLDQRLVSVDARHHTGFMMKTRETKGDPKTYYYRKGSAASTISSADIDAVDPSGLSLVHLTGILPPLSPSTMDAAEAMVVFARRNNLFLSFDPNLRPALWVNEAVMKSTLRHLCAQSDLVLPGIAEGRELFGVDDVESIGRAFIDNGARVVVVKDGPRGAYATNGTDSVYVPGFVVDHVVDTVGAGDGFAAGLLSALLEGHGIAVAMERGCAVGAMQTQVVSDNEGLPTADRLDEFMMLHERATPAQASLV
ncbi:sugar kinase [Bifidobacterium saguinibicoloris]|uniref:sugar kinase n=1 Tax=Bifidobacterium saguinibicoloris TaxID=2834433 RepID=UPI001C567478|nr:sugar kinase [Bifidobacterium saguinibicoloris]MBW3080493.1 sugar kinase [Bifidobacterium saguinibicoloris]